MLTAKGKSKTVRKQILFSREELDYILKTTRELGLSQSGYIRELVNEDRRKRRQEELRAAALSVMDLYKGDKELTAFTSLDGEDVL